VNPILILLTAVLLAPLAALHAVPAKPNIVFILADDLGFAEISANGSDRYQTPHIDSLAKTGIRFSRFYTAPLCGPSRALILTGRYAFRTGAVTQDACASIVRTGEKAEVMIPTVLKKAGYTTAMIGKWGQLLPAGDAAEWGFDHMMSFKASGVYWNKAAAATWVKQYGLDGDKFGEGGVRANPGPYNINAKKLTMADHEYMPDLMHKDAMAFIKENKDRPFFLYYSLAQVHSQILPTPDSAPPAPGLDAAARYLQVYRDNITYMDKLVGKLLAELERLKLRNNTVVLFMGDNGTAKANADHATIGGRRLIGQKGGMEGWCRSSSVGAASRPQAGSTKTSPTPPTCSPPSRRLPARRCRRTGSSMARACCPKSKARRNPRAPGPSPKSERATTSAKPAGNSTRAASSST